MTGSPKELAAVLFLFFILATTYVWTMPPFESSDELSHLEFVKRLLLEGRLPIVTKMEYFAAEEHQPPTYYVLAALVGRALISTPLRDDFGQMTLIFYGARGLSVLFGLAAVAGTYLLASHVFGPRPLLRLATTALVAFNPSFISIMAAVTNDSLAAAVGAFILLATVKIAAARPISLKWLIATGLLVGIGAISKENLLYLFLPLAVALTVMARRTAQYPLRVLVAVGLPAVAVGAWWYVRNWALYGDPLAWNINALLSPGNIHRETPDVHSYLSMINDSAQTFWVGLGQSHGIRAAMPIYAVLWMGGAIALLGLYQLFRVKKRLVPWSSGLSLGLGLLAIDVALTFLAVLRYHWSFIGAGSGRFFFPVAGAIAVLLILGLAHALPTRIPWLPIGFSSLLLTLSVVSPFVYLLPLRVSPLVVTTAELASQAQPVDATFDGSLQLVGYRIPNPRVRPGESLPVSLYWKAMSDTTVNWTNYIHIVDGQNGNTMVGQYDSIPLRGSYPTYFWRKGQIWREDYQVPLRPDALDGYYQLEVGFYDLRTGRGAPVSAQGKEWMGGLRLGQLRVLAPQVSAKPKNPLEADFQESIRLVGWDWERNTVTLYWQPTNTITRSLTVFAHFLDSESRMIAQHDGWPARGRLPTFVWEPGEIIRDEHPVAAPPGTYSLEVGLYDSLTQQRVPLTTGSSSLFLGTVDVP
ncbi:MAG: glycosyltransferase family 39 protein [Chloroflexi bacterium]|nr:glycosyltransferase family 39 protein [Chloroflexota bacterium]